MPTLTEKLTEARGLLIALSLAAEVILDLYNRECDGEGVDPEDMTHACVELSKSIYAADQWAKPGKSPEWWAEISG